MTAIVRLLLRRIAVSFIVLLGVSFLVFAIARVIPGDPARIALGPNASAQAIAALRAELHLNDSFLTQYGYFLGGLFRGDLGISLYTNRPVTTDIAQFLPATLELVIIAGLIMVGCGLPLGIMAARHRGHLPDHIIRIVALLTVSAPGFVWAVVLMLLFAYYLPLFPVAGRIADSFQVPTVTGFLLIDTLLAGDVAACGNALWHILLPAFALALAGIGQTARLIRANMVETYGKPYIEMAEAYGFAQNKIARKYALRPSMIPSLTVIGLDFASMLGNAFLIETVFAWPGLSRYGVAVILRKDLNGIVGTVLVIAATFLIVNIVVDLLVPLVNPRIRFAAGRA